MSVEAAEIIATAIRAAAGTIASAIIANAGIRAIFNK